MKLHTTENYLEYNYFFVSSKNLTSFLQNSPLYLYSVPTFIYVLFYDMYL